MKHQDSARHILRLGGGGYLMWHIDHHYARYFTQEVDLENYLSTGDYDNQPEMLFDAVIRQYGDSLVNHADELVLHLHASSIIEKEKLDYSLESLEELAVALSWQQKAIYSEDLALAMLAYTGEVLKRVKRGKWAQVKEEQTQMSLPVIQSSKDQTDNVREWALKYWPVQ
jgi:ribonuclease HII